MPSLCKYYVYYPKAVVVLVYKDEAHGTVETFPQP